MVDPNNNNTNNENNSSGSAGPSEPVVVVSSTTTPSQEQQQQQSSTRVRRRGKMTTTTTRTRSANARDKSAFGLSNKKATSTVILLCCVVLLFGLGYPISVWYILYGKQQQQQQQLPQPTRTNTAEQLTTMEKLLLLQQRIQHAQELQQQSNMAARSRLDQENSTNNNKNKNNHREDTAAEGYNHCTEYNTYPFPEGHENGCIVHAVSGRPHCQFWNLHLDTTKLHSKAMGGEPLEAVMGQDEEDEVITYDVGAFVYQAQQPAEDVNLPTEGSKTFYYVNDILKVIRAAGQADTSHSGIAFQSDNCTMTLPGTTLFIARVDYVNLYHTLTEWWNTFFSIPFNNINRTTGSSSSNDHNEEEQQQLHIVFLDAHPRGNLDPVWHDMFQATSVTFVRHFAAGTVCMERARFVPAGATASIAPLPGTRSQKCPDPHRMKWFVHRALAAYNLTHVHRIPGHVVVIDRVPYLAHPRALLAGRQRVVSNLRDLAMALPDRLQMEKNIHITVQVATLVNESFAKQIETIRKADILIANHGAGLAHSIFLEDAAHVLEMSCQRRFFLELSKWTGRTTTVIQDFQHDYQESHGDNVRRNAANDNGRHHCLVQEIEQEITEEYWNTHVVNVIEKLL